MKKLITYSGNKCRLLKYFPDVPADTKRLVECYAGSMAWSMNSSLPYVAYEINPAMVAMYEWLKSQTPDDLRSMPQRFDEKIDIRTLGYELGKQTYYQLHLASVMVGQLSSWTSNPKHHLPIEKTIECLPRLCEGNIILGSCHDLYTYQDGDFVLLDPPYINTKANYKAGEKMYKIEDTCNLINKMPRGRWMMTYSSVPPQFGNYNVLEICKRVVPNLRKGGTTNRTEYLFT
jgi:site-specific DNA-adenine methylase